MKKIIRTYTAFSVLVVAVAISFLFSPKPVMNDYHGKRIEINRYMGYIANGDSWDFYSAAYEPSKLLSPEFTRQNRPLYVFMGTVIGYPLHYGLLKHLNFDWKVSFYAAFVIINFFILFFSLIIFYKKLNGLSFVVTASLLVVLISNPVTKAFFWTPHTQLFNILVPLLCIYGAETFSLRKMSPLQTGMLSFACGFLTLIYGSFLLLFPAWYIGRYFNKNYSRISKLVFEAFLNGVLFCLPMLLWIAVCNHFAGSFYNHETVVYRQFVWIADTFGNSFSDGIAAMSSNLHTYGEAFNQLELFVLLPMFIYGFATNRASKDKLCLLILLLFIFFFYFLGFYPMRLTYNLVPLMLYGIVGMFFSRLDKIKYPVFVFAIVWHCYEGFSYGPFS